MASADVIFPDKRLLSIKLSISFKIRLLQGFCILFGAFLSDRIPQRKHHKGSQNDHFVIIKVCEVVFKQLKYRDGREKCTLISKIKSD